MDREDTPFRLVVFTAGTHKVPELHSCHENESADEPALPESARAQEDHVLAADIEQPAKKTSGDLSLIHI